eukprot:COSAG01_NODE_8225_length_2868_cov_1.199711_3_plen_60_part_01
MPAFTLKVSVFIDSNVAETLCVFEPSSPAQQNDQADPNLMYLVCPPKLQPAEPRREASFS